MVRANARRDEAVQVGLILIVLAVMMVPIIWIGAAAFKRSVDVFQLKLWFEPTLTNFFDITRAPYRIQDKFLNSTIVASVTVLIAIPLATMASYGFSRFRLRGEKLMFVVILGSQFLPAVVIVLPFFIMFRDLGLLDSRLGLIIVDLALVMPFAIWMIKGFIDGIPIEIEEAAMIDGAGRAEVIRRVILPLAAPGIVTAGIFCFIIAWNEFLFALILTTNNAVTLPVGLALFKAEEGELWHYIAAAGIIIMVPMWVLALIIQKHFVQGMTMGAVK
ncbi:MAG: carbohydrate ABC transporter permease [Pseudomonadota bacterium]